MFTDPKTRRGGCRGIPAGGRRRLQRTQHGFVGPGEDLEQIATRFGDDGIRCTWLETSHAFHSGCSTRCSTNSSPTRGFDVRRADPAAGLQPHRRRLTADTRSTPSTGGGTHASLVQFAESVRTVAALGCTVLMEIGPQPVLTGAAVQVWRSPWPRRAAIVSMRKGVADRRQIADAVAAAYT